MRVLQNIHLAYSFFVYLSHVVPAYGIIFHPSIEVAPDPERDAIYDAVDALRRTAQANSVDSEWDDNMFLIATATDMFGDADNQDIGLLRYYLSLNANGTPLLERAHNLVDVNLEETLYEDAIGIDPTMLVYGLGHLSPVPDDPNWMYDDWANVFIPNDANYQRCARRAGQGEALVMASTFVIGGNNSPTLSYIAICADGQAWAQSFDDTLYDIMELPHALLSQMTIDAFQTLDFALLTQILHTPIALGGIADTASAMR